MGRYDTYTDINRFAGLPNDLLMTKWFSWSGDAISDDNDGYLTELEKLGASVTIATGLGQSPLRPVSSLDRLLGGCNNPTILEISIHLYDTTLIGSGNQHAATLTEISNTVDPSAGTPPFSVSDAYSQSRFRNALVGGWQPNFVRPTILVNDRAVIFGDFRRGYEYDSADASIGLDVPWCGEIVEQIGQPVNRIDVFCPAGQIVTGVGRIQRYAVSMEILWDLRDEPIE